MTVFISYSHKDEAWKDRLVKQLGVLQAEGVLEVWDDRRIEAGEDWQPEIERAIEHAAVAILLVSADFLTSKFILGVEVPRLLERRQKEGVRVIPLIVWPCPGGHRLRRAERRAGRPERGWVRAALGPHNPGGRFAPSGPGQRGREALRRG